MKKMAIMSEPRNKSYDTAYIPLYDENDKVCNLITVEADDILYFAATRKTSGYSDISGQTVKIVIHDDEKTADGKIKYDENGKPVTVTISAIVEIVRGNDSKYVFKYNDTVWQVPKANAKLYKI